MTITSTNFLSGALILFASAPALSVTINSATQIQAVTPANAAGLVEVTVEDPGSQSANLASGFIYNSSPSGPPTISGVSPASGSSGTQVTITGTNLAAADTVSFGSTNGTPTLFNGATQLLATVPSISAGTYNVTATNPDPASTTLNGGFTVTAPARNQSLLTGCTVSASNAPSCSIPAGWSLAIAQGFESGAVGPNEQLVGTGTSISTVQAHSGSRSMQETISAEPAGNQSPGGDWLLNVGALGCCTNGEIYMSWWTYLDPTAVMNTESVFAEYGVPGEGVLMDTQNFTGKNLINTGISLFVSPQTDVVPPGINAGFTGGNFNLNLGTWEQEELYFKGSTCSGRASKNDGIMLFYINGQLRFRLDSRYRDPNNPNGPNGGNLNGCVDMTTNAHISAGGYWTYFAGNPTTFHKYIDDIIVLKR